jgi:hypothetical protein
VARELQTHRLSIALPGGGMETVEYSGNVAPRVVFHPVMVPLPDAFAPLAWPAGFGLPSFAAFDRVAAEMDAQMNAMMRQAALLSRLPKGQPLSEAVLKDLPAGATSFSMVSETTSNGVCTHVTRITHGVGDAKPRVVSQTSGDCGQGAHDAAPAQSGLKQVDFHAPAVKLARTAL